MERREYEVLWSYYYGMGKTTMAGIDTIRELDKKKVIKKIYEITDNDYNEVWYLIRDAKEKSYILKSKCGNTYANDVMKEFKAKYEFYRITTDVIKIFNNDIYPIVFKIKEQDFGKYYDELRNINNAFFHNYYCHINNTYKTIREYRNKVEVETFDKETDAIYWCSDFDITKEQILSNDIRPFDLNEKVYNYDF